MKVLVPGRGDERLKNPVVQKLMAEISARIKYLKSEYKIVTFKGDDDPVLFFPQD